MIAHFRRCLSGVLLALTALLFGSGGFAYAQDNAALYKSGIAAFEAGDFEQAYFFWKPLAENGYAGAQYTLGKLFDRGGGPIEQNSFMAALWYRQAAAQGVAAARNNLAIMYAQGRGVPANAARAVELWHQAALQDHPMAQFNLGLSYFNGDGVEADPEVAVQWFVKAAESGVVGAQYAMGQILRQGAGVPADPPLALAWYDRAAEQGYEPAQQAAAELRQTLDLPPAQQVAGDRSTAGDKPTPELTEPGPSTTEPEPSSPQPEQTASTEATEATEAGTTAAHGLADAQPPEPQQESPAQTNQNGDRVETASRTSKDFVAVTPEVTDEGGVVWESLPAAPEPAQSGAASALPAEPTAAATEAHAVETVEALAAEMPPNSRFPDDRAAPVAAPILGRIEGGPKSVAASDGAVAEPTGSQVAEVPPVPTEVQSPPKTPIIPRRKPQFVSASPIEVVEPDAAEPPDDPVLAEERPEAVSLAAVTTAARSAAQPVGAIDFPPGTFSIWLASTADGAAAQDFWGLVAESYPQLFGKVDGTVRRVDLGEFGVYYRVLAGSWQDREAAHEVCLRLRLRQPDAFCKIQEN
jgi:TPR repeat protein